MHNKLINITKIFTFDSAHKLENYEGKCANLHGHTYTLEVTVRGQVDARGMVIDFVDLKTIVKETVIEPLDHRYLNDVFKFNTTCENMVVWIFEKVEKQLAEHCCHLYKVKLWETPTSYAEIERNDFYNECQ